MNKVPRVVIVGAGYTGAYLGRLLQKESFCKVTVVDPRDAMMHCVAALRCIVEPEFLKNVFIPYSKFLEDFVQQRATAILKDEKLLLLDNGTRISYDYLVIASGTNNRFPGKTGEFGDINMEEAKKLYRKLNEAVKKSQKIVCVGAGAVGVEIAGEIKTDFPDKEVTVIQAGNTVLSANAPVDLQTALKVKMAERGINLLLGDRVTNLDELKLNEHVDCQLVQTTSGKAIEADLVIPCIGTKVLTGFCKPALESAMEADGRIRVNERLLVEGCGDIFAIGDANAVREEKMAYTGKKHSDYLAANLKAIIEGKEVPAFVPSDNFEMIVPVGRNGGVGLFGGYMLDDEMCQKYKCHDMYSTKTWEELGLKLPS